MLAVSSICHGKCGRQNLAALESPIQSLGATAAWREFPMTRGLDRLAGCVPGTPVALPDFLRR